MLCVLSLSATSHSLLHFLALCVVSTGVTSLLGRVSCWLVLEQNTWVRPAQAPHWPLGLGLA